MGGYVVDLGEVDATQVAAVGGKGARLGEISRIGGVRVPAGFCVTTDAFRRTIRDAAAVDGRLAGLGRLARLRPGDREAIRTGSREVRQALEDAAIPDEVAAAIAGAVARHGPGTGYAVRSSATAEDLPAASSAGQHDTHLNVVGTPAILRHVSRCWASLYTERAVAYRLRHGVDPRTVDMAVVVQRMLFPQVAGVLFTADPVTSNRKVASVEATYGLGEGLVSGQVNADVYRVRDGEVVARAVAVKPLAIGPSPAGGTLEEPVDPARQAQPALTDAQAVRLVRLGRRIEAHFGCPQDIEWCLVDGELHVVQSRPITTLFPIPEADDGANHVYVSVGHQQMMTDAMKPLGLSVWQLTTPRPMSEAGGRLFVDVTALLGSAASRDRVIEVLGRSDPLVGDALRTVVDRGEFVPPLPDDGPGWAPPGAAAGPIETDPSVVPDLVAASEASIAGLRRQIRAQSGTALFDFIRADLQELRRRGFDPRSMQVVLAAMEATWWLDERLQDWLGEQGAADTLTRSVPHNVTSEMGLALLDVADVIRPHPGVVAFLRQVADEDFLDRLTSLDGGEEAAGAIRAYLDRYGMRCVGEIDITRPRWSEQPATLLPLILADVDNFDPGEAGRRFERGRQEAERKEHDVLARLAVQAGGEQKAKETKRMIDRVRTFAGYREYPKYGIVSRYFVYRQALLAEAERLVQAGVLRERDDVYFLRFEELRQVVRTGQVDDDLIRRRRQAFRSYQRLTPPRVLTSDGEAVAGAYHRLDDVPTGALAGLAVSAGTVEGRARVILDLDGADVVPGDILVTAYTDPSWSPLFVAVAGLVTEVGGLMTHGAVVAREYGLPAVVGVEQATARIEDGQRVRVNGTDGYVEILPPT